MKKRVVIIFLTVMAPLLFLFSFPTFLDSHQTVHAQSGGIVVDKQLQRTNPVVRVGEELTFTIRIENQTAFTVTTLPLSDTYNAAVLGYLGAVPAPDNVDTGNGRIDWDDLTTTFGNLAPGQQITVTVIFIAEHPETAVVNQAEVHDALGTGGAIGNADDTDNTGESIGGSMPLNKRINDGITPTAGLPITFTISITNDGAVTTTVVPLTENYDPTFIQFNFAVPPPDIVNELTGILTWTDVTSYFGDIPAFGSVDVTVVFTALTAINNSINEASISGAVDWYGNDLDGGADDVPITIIDGPAPANTPAPTTTPAPNPTNTPRPSGSSNSPANTPIPTPTATATAVPAAAFPETGIPPKSLTPLTAVFAIIAAFTPVALWLWHQRRRALK